MNYTKLIVVNSMTQIFRQMTTPNIISMTYLKSKYDFYFLV